MKKSLALLIVAIMILSLAACGSKTTENTEDTGKDQSPSGTQSTDDTTDEVAGAADAEEDLPGEEFDVGDYTVYVPGGWTAIKQQDPNDTTSVSTSIIRIYRGASYDNDKKVWVLSGLPYIEVSYFEGEDIDKVPGDKSSYDSTEDIEDVTIGNFTWQGFNYEEYGMKALIWTLDEERGYRLTVSLTEDVDLDDADVQAVIESLK